MTPRPDDIDAQLAERLRQSERVVLLAAFVCTPVGLVAFLLLLFAKRSAAAGRTRIAAVTLRVMEVVSVASVLCVAAALIAFCIHGSIENF